MMDPTTIAPVVAQGGQSGLVLDAIVRIVGFVILSGVVAAGVTFVYRWYSAEAIPEGVAVLTGVVVVALWLNTQTVLQDAIIGDAEVLDPATAIYTVGAFAASAVAADGGRRAGDHLATRTAIPTPRGMDDVGQFVKTGGRVITVELPTEIADAEGYDPVDDGTKAAIAGRTLLFPRRLTVAQLRERVIDRLEADYGVGYVDVSVATDGTVERLALGSKAAGLGPTLAPGTVAIAVRGDPAPDAGPGDTLEVWIPGEDGPRRLGTAEVRATVDDVATIVVSADAKGLRRDAPGRQCRLVTRPDTPDPERAVRALLRSVPETITRIAVVSDGPWAGESVGSLPVLVLAVVSADRAVAESEEPPGDDAATVSALPGPDRRLEAGDTCFVLGHPEALERVRAASASQGIATEAGTGER